ncbi:DNA alkylation repair protein [Candidatus Pacearchaeota archaeon]|nr:DNA alkylation repair protein [Candidatus Pacearchaeota archaeon]
MIKYLDKLLEEFSEVKRAEINKRFFKTNEGEYGYGDIFLGITVPQCRILAKQFLNLRLEDIKILLNDNIHEKRLIGLLMLVEKFKKADKKDKEKIYNFYLDNLNGVNNWDLVDLTADKIIGNFLLDKDKEILYKLTTGNIWERRIAIISTFAFIKKNKFDDTFRISEILMNDKEDLIHKAVGWMLREVGKRDKKQLEEFLYKHYKKMPRTMLRYAIEKFENEKRIKYLKGKM